MVAAIAALAGGSLVAGGCSDSDNNNGGGGTNATYRVTVTNLTNNQPLSPLGVILHDNQYRGWDLGAAVTDGLEQLAEGGDPAAFLAEADGSMGVSATAAGGAAVPPGGSSVVTQTVPLQSGQQLTVASMLVNTNDAFWGVTGMSVGGLGVGDEIGLDMLPFDAGTEANTESAATIPGPAGGGEGFNADRTAEGFVAVHAGVVTADDGLATSALDESHRFQSPVARILIERVE
jgi:hypothetical protein